MVYCSGLRELDAVLGNDEKFIQNICEAAKEMHPNFIALVGSPVPMVIGTDLAGMAAWIEDETGIPAFGFPTTGLGLYPSGAFLAGKTLLQHAWKTDKKHQMRDGMNILGDLPLDFAGTDFMERFQALMQERNIPVQASLFDRADMDQVSKVASARWNTAVSYSGALLGVWLWQTRKMPCITGFPMSNATAERWHSLAREGQQHGGITAWGIQKELCGRGDGILILGDQMTANSLRAEIFYATWKRSCVGLPFGAQTESLGTGDLILKNEAQIQSAVNDPEITVIIGDPLYRQLLDEPEKKRFLPLLHYAVSSKVGQSLCPDGGKIHEEFFKQFA